MCEGSRTHGGYYTDRQLLSYIPEMREPHHVHMTLGMHNSASSVGYTSSTSSQNLPIMPLAILAGFVRSDSVISECHFFFPEFSSQKAFHVTVTASSCESSCPLLQDNRITKNVFNMTNRKCYITYSLTYFCFIL